MQPEPPSSPRIPRIAKSKNPRIAVVLALVLGIIGLWGMGHIYVGKVRKGIKFLAFGIAVVTITYLGFGGIIILGVGIAGALARLAGDLVAAVVAVLVSTILVLLLLAIAVIVFLAGWIWQAYDAYKLAKQFKAYFLLNRLAKNIEAREHPPVFGSAVSLLRVKSGFLGLEWDYWFTDSEILKVKILPRAPSLFAKIFAPIFVLLELAFFLLGGTFFYTLVSLLIPWLAVLDLLELLLVIPILIPILLAFLVAYAITESLAGLRRRELVDLVPEKLNALGKVTDRIPWSRVESVELHRRKLTIRDSQKGPRGGKRELKVEIKEADMVALEEIVRSKTGLTGLTDTIRTILKKAAGQ